MTIEEIQTQTALVPRFKNGAPLTGPVTARAISQLLIDDAAEVRTFIRSGLSPDADLRAAVARIIALGMELLPMLGVSDVGAFMDASLPKAEAKMAVRS